METWLIILLSISISALLKALITYLFNTNKPYHNLPPGPFTFPIIGNFRLLCKSLLELSLIIRPLHAKLGPIVTLHIGSRPTIFISDRSLAHQALIQNGAVYADRPRPLATKKVISSNQLSINAASYGLTWRLLRRNLTAEILHPSRVRSFMNARKCVLQILLERLKAQSKKGDSVAVFEDLQYPMFCLFVLMCFGEKFNREKVEEIMEAQRSMMSNIGQFKVLNFWPRLTKIVLRKRWEQFYKLRENQEVALRPLIRERRKKQENKSKENEDEYMIPYLDTLFNLELPNEKRKLEEGELISLCSEFLNAGTDTTSVVLEWIMANLVKNPHIQEKLYMEIKQIVKEGEEEVNEDDLQKMPYLKAVVLEGLRRHPPTHLGLPHAVAEDVTLDGFLVPRKASIYFNVAEIGLDSKVWEDPMEFKPERFLSRNVNGDEVFDLSGSKEIKMMPFGAGRRICPGMSLAMLLMEYILANMVWWYEWKAMDGDEVNMEEKLDVMLVMKNPLQALIYPRLK